ncbi:MAG TPA: EpsI family protein [Pyrinomonadaceae bacterium]|jgi:exosortase D (VPLPA-CTERM-specific)|nr:EpsI family protein [Pyrinomonadaceae bacterium]
MSEPTQKLNKFPIAAIVVAAALAFLYSMVLAKLGRDWWTDENYSHGLLVPFVIAIIIWKERHLLAWTVTLPNVALGWIGVTAALLFLIAGTLGAELFTQRISLVVMVAAVVVYFFGRKLLSLLAVPFSLLLLAIPIPQIIFNRIAFPLQIWASQMAVWGIRLFEVPTVRKGNVIDILPKGGIQSISLEVVEACSGIRSLVTLVTLALILAYFTRRRDSGGFANMTRADLVRTALLMLSAVLIAVITNAARVTATGVLTYYYGKKATEATWHDLSGWLVYVVALAMLIGVNAGLRRLIRGSNPESSSIADPGPASRVPSSAFRIRRVIPLVVALVLGGIVVNWLANRSEAAVERQPLSRLATTLGDWRQRGNEIRFDKNVEGVLGASDYTMREYTDPTGRIANIYVGYYATQRTGSTYHSPQNCLPGAGWILSDPQVVTVTAPSGRTFTANRYTIENGVYKEVMIYWYQGRGRTEASEYRDKLNTVLDSVTRRRTDGSMVRVMTDVGTDGAAAVIAASSLAAGLADQLPPFIPE